jgi:hypothetical protein
LTGEGLRLAVLDLRREGNAPVVTGEGLRPAVLDLRREGNALSLPGLKDERSDAAPLCTGEAMAWVTKRIPSVAGTGDRDAAARPPTEKHSR